MGEVYPKSGCNSNMVNLSSGTIRVNDFDHIYTPASPYALQLVFKFNKYREVKPYVAVLDSFDFNNVSY